MERQRIGLWIVALIGLALIFQLFFRYQYLARGDYIVRIDRLTLASCYLPCRQTPEQLPLAVTPLAPSPTPKDPLLEGITYTPSPNPLFEGLNNTPSPEPQNPLLKGIASP